MTEKLVDLYIGGVGAEGDPKTKPFCQLNLSSHFNLLFLPSLFSAPPPPPPFFFFFFFAHTRTFLSSLNGFHAITKYEGLYKRGGGGGKFKRVGH